MRARLFDAHNGTRALASLRALCAIECAKEETVCVTIEWDNDSGSFVTIYYVYGVRDRVLTFIEPALHASKVVAVVTV
eukprot:108842-Prorocentrum_minimum.AAC.3